MKRTDDVFFFTLIDFLLQVFFFGLLLFVVGQVLQEEAKKAEAAEQAAKEGLFRGAGVSSISELTDWLTLMVPLDHLRGLKDFMVRNGGFAKVEAATNAASAAGGADKVGKLQRRVDAAEKRVSELEGGWGKVSCIPNVMVNGKQQPKSVARVTVEDNRITLDEPTAEMTDLLKTLNLRYEDVRVLDPAAFRKTFAPVVAQQPGCRYFLTGVTRTQYLAPMNAVWSAFRMQ